MNQPTAYPLAWPANWPRTGPGLRAKGAYRTTLPAALKNLRDQLRLLAGPAVERTLVLSSNATLGVDAPADPGVVAYFVWDQKPLAIPCDRWQRIEQNVQAIALSIEAMRAIERHGAKHMVTAMFSGFLALPAPARTWREVLGLPAGPHSARDVETMFRRLAEKMHPDRGGSHDAMAALLAARDQGLKEVGNA
jgi:hypothetical protein